MHGLCSLMCCRTVFFVSCPLNAMYTTTWSGRLFCLVQQHVNNERGFNASGRWRFADNKWFYEMLRTHTHTHTHKKHEAHRKRVKILWKHWREEETKRSQSAYRNLFNSSIMISDANRWILTHATTKRESLENILRFFSSNVMQSSRFDFQRLL